MNNNGERRERLSKLSDEEVLERVEAAVDKMPYGIVSEAINRWAETVGHEHGDEPVVVWCLDCEWEKEIHAKDWDDWDRSPQFYAKKSAAGHIGNREGCERYSIGEILSGGNE